MARKKKALTTRTGTKIRQYARRVRSSKGGGFGGLGTIALSVFVYRFITDFLTKEKDKIPLLGTLPYAVPLAVYFLAKKNIIPIKGLETISLTILVKEVIDDFMQPGTTTAPATVPAQGYYQPQLLPGAGYYQEMGRYNRPMGETVRTVESMRHELSAYQN